MNKLHNKLKIVKESNKAVAVKSLPMEEKDYKTVQWLFWEVGNTYIKGNLFWLPKSQVEIDGDCVVAVSSFIKRVNDKFWDSPLMTEKEFKKVKLQYRGN